MPPTPTALLMTALALLVLPACSGFRTVARVSEWDEGSLQSDSAEEPGRQMSEEGGEPDPLECWEGSCDDGGGAKGCLIDGHYGRRRQTACDESCDGEDCDPPSPPPSPPPGSPPRFARSSPLQGSPCWGGRKEPNERDAGSPPSVRRSLRCSSP